VKVGSIKVKVRCTTANKCFIFRRKNLQGSFRIKSLVVSERPRSASFPTGTASSDYTKNLSRDAWRHNTQPSFSRPPWSLNKHSANVFSDTNAHCFTADRAPKTSLLKLTISKQYLVLEFLSSFSLNTANPLIVKNDPAKYFFLALE